MSWLSYFYPQTIVRMNSPYNADIRIIEEAGKLKLLVGGSPQSGPYIARLWKNVLPRNALQKHYPHATVLVLGIGGGTVIKLLRTILPQAGIIGVDIDPQMIAIARRYFDIDILTDVKLIEDDAVNYLHTAVAAKRKFDILIVDLFIGRHIPVFVGTDMFLRLLKSVLDPSGMLIINYLREKEYKTKSNVLLDKLRNIFHSVIEKKLFLNRFFLCMN